MAFTQIYMCPVHGQVDAVLREVIDTINDEVYEIMMCARLGCQHTVESLMHKGKPVLRPLTEAEIEAEVLFEQEAD